MNYDNMIIGYWVYENITQCNLKLLYFIIDFFKTIQLELSIK